VAFGAARRTLTPRLPARRSFGPCPTGWVNSLSGFPSPRGRPSAFAPLRRDPARSPIPNTPLICCPLVPSFANKIMFLAQELESPQHSASPAFLQEVRLVCGYPAPGYPGKQTVLRSKKSKQNSNAGCGWRPVFFSAVTCNRAERKRNHYLSKN